MISLLASGVASIYRDRERLRTWLRAVVVDHGAWVGELNFVLMSDRELLTYNQRYLGHDDYTDVITFQGETGKGTSGDILLSLDRIKANARTYDVSVQHELRRVMVHGLLHLLGHADKSARARAAMREAEDRYLQLY